jgi:seryl-tRNA synthetase
MAGLVWTSTLTAKSWKNFLYGRPHPKLMKLAGLKQRAMKKGALLPVGVKQAGEKPDVAKPEIGPVSSEMEEQKRKERELKTEEQKRKEREQKIAAEMEEQKRKEHLQKVASVSSEIEELKKKEHQLLAEVGGVQAKLRQLQGVLQKLEAEGVKLARPEPEVAEDHDAGAAPEVGHVVDDREGTDEDMDVLVVSADQDSDDEFCPARKKSRNWD